MTWRLILVTLPLSIAAITALAGTWMGLAWPVALLLGASLAPTDPVLAADVQVGPPKTGEEDEVRFGLTSEAGMNDGAAFPFVHLAIALSLAAATGEPWAMRWLTYNVLWEIGAGVAGGYLIGRHPECDSVINVPTVSNRHCLFFPENKEGDAIAVLEDLSGNGTYVNDGIVGRNKHRQLSDGTVY